MRKKRTSAEQKDGFMGPVAQRLVEYVEVAAIAILLAFFLRTFVVQAFMIPTGSMENTLLRGDHILVNRMIYSSEGLGPLKWILPVREPERLDIMVFKNPTKLEQDYIKRMVAMPGDAVAYEAKRLSVNGVGAAHGFERHGSPWVIPRDRDKRDFFGPLDVPEGHYFMMGDNRDNSKDSRYWGPLDAALVKGRAFLVYFSWMPSNLAFQDKSHAERPHSLAESVWFNITHLGDRLRLGRTLNVIR